MRGQWGSEGRLEDICIYQGFPPKQKGLIREIQSTLYSRQEVEAITKVAFVRVEQKALI